MIQSFQQVLRQTFCKGRLLDWVHMSKKEGQHWRHHSVVSLWEPNWFRSGGLKEFSAIQATGSISTSYGEVPADRRSPCCLRKKKGMEELVKQDQVLYYLFCFMVWHSWGWKKQVPTSDLSTWSYLHKTRIIYSLAKWRLNPSDKLICVSSVSERPWLQNHQWDIKAEL